MMFVRRDASDKNGVQNAYSSHNAGITDMLPRVGGTPLSSWQLNNNTNNSKHLCSVYPIPGDIQSTSRDEPKCCNLVIYFYEYIKYFLLAFFFTVLLIEIERRNINTTCRETQPKKSEICSKCFFLPFFVHFGYWC